MQGIITEKDGRIRELEQALRESVRLTAEREIYASGRDDETRHLEQQVYWFFLVLQFPDY